MFLASEIGERSLPGASKSFSKSCLRKFVAEKLLKLVGSHWSRRRWWKEERFASACSVALM